MSAPTIRACRVMPSLSTAFGGPVASSIELCQALRRKNIDFTLIAPRSELKQADASGLDVRSMRGLQVGKSEFLGVFSPPAILWTLRHRKSFDVWHITFARSAFTLSLGWLLMLTRTPYVLSTHGMCRPWTGWKRLIDWLLVGPVLRHAQAVMVLNAEEARQLKRLDRDKLAIVPNLVADVASDDPGTTAPVATPRPWVLFAARLHPRKNVSAFVEMCRILVDDYQFQGSCLVVGPDEGDLGLLKNLPTDRWAQQLTYLGELAHHELVALMRQCDLFVQPAFDEPFGRTIFEAMSVGLPCIIARSAAYAEELAAAGAVSVSREDGRQLAAAVVTLLADDAARLAQVQAARNFLQRRLDPNRITDQVHQIYAAAMNG
jgi:glycosyltransferase involved in cell wall biosynthesis